MRMKAPGMIRPRDAAESFVGAELDRAIYLTAGALSTALRSHGLDDSRLYPDHLTPLATWAAEHRGNFCWLISLLAWSVARHGEMRGILKPRGGIRYLQARSIMYIALGLASHLPTGRAETVPPLLF